jgi:hypothetical protein
MEREISTERKINQFLLWRDPEICCPIYLNDVYVYLGFNTKDCRKVFITA